MQGTPGGVWAAAGGRMACGAWNGVGLFNMGAGTYACESVHADNGRVMHGVEASSRHN